MEKILNERMYENKVNGASVMGSQVEVIGERTIKTEDGRVLEQYIYNIVGYTPKNGKPFVALKANIFLF